MTVIFDTNVGQLFLSGMVSTQMASKLCMSEWKWEINRLMVSNEYLLNIH